MKPGLPRLIRPLAYLGLLLASLPSTSGATGDLPTIRDVKGRPVPLEVPKGGALAIVFLSAECPIANAESPTIDAIAHAFPAERFRLVGVFVDPDLTHARLAAHAAEYHLTFPVACDPGLALARHFKATVTPEAFVLDDGGRVRYRGRIDDAFAARTKRNAAPKTRELRDAVAAVLDGRPVDQPEVKAVGCPLPEPAAASSASATYHRDVEPILQTHCQDCHRPGQVAPFSLLTFDQARKRSDDLASLAADRRMPPWPASPDEGGPFRDSRLLSPKEIATLEAWADAGARGRSQGRPLTPTFPGEWPLGLPDLVLTVPEP